MTIRDQLVGKDARQRAAIKTATLFDMRPNFTRGRVSVRPEYDVELQIAGVERSSSGALLVFAKAWRRGKKVGFGSDGSVEIEKFQIFNPPILVPDEFGGIIRDIYDEEGVKTGEYRLREDPVQAIMETVAHNVTVVGKDGANIVNGKVGNTTSTFYPDANPETTSVDGATRRTSVSEAWATIRSGAGNSVRDTAATETGANLNSNGTTWTGMHRSIYGFDTSAITDSDTISSATLSFYGVNVRDNFSLSTVIDRNVPGSATALATSDFNIGNWDGVEQSSTRIAVASFATGAYNDYTLNASGLSNVNKTGVSWYGMRTDADFDNSEPTPASASGGVDVRGADSTGTTEDPKFVVEHVAASTFIPKHWIM